MNRILLSIVRACASPSQTVAGAALLLAIFSVGSRVLGLIRDRVLASRFGAGDALDVYYASFRIPDLLYSFLVLGALSAAFIPVFTEMMEKGETKHAWKLTSDMVVFIGGVMVIASVACVFFMPHLAMFIAPGFEGEKREALILLSRIMFLSPFFLGLSAVFGGVLVAKRYFFAYSLAPLLYNAGIIFGAVVLVPLWGLNGLAWGVVTGSFFHCLTQMTAARRLGLRVTFSTFAVWKDREIRRIIKLMTPQALAMASNQVSFFVVTLFASFLSTGSLAVYNFANNLQSIPLGLVGVSFGVAVFPKLSSLAAKAQWQEFSNTIEKTILRILYFVVPISAILVLLRAQIVRVVLGAGSFDWADTEFTFQVLAILSLSLFAQSLLPLLSRCFYSLQDTRTPLYVSLFSQTINVGLAALFFRSWGVHGLAVAFSVSSIVNSLLLVLLLRYKIPHYKQTYLVPVITRIVIASLLAALAAQFAKTVVGSVAKIDTFPEVFFQLCASLTVAAAVYGAASYFLGIEEFNDLRTKLYIRMFGKSKALSAPEGEDMERM